jgi:DNA invertase Pin-like site-specific DNA recombinase
MSQPDTAASRRPSAAPTALPSPPVAAPLSGYEAKIRSPHRTRLALVYVRQSSPQQVLHHRESAARQYGLAHRAVALGWPEQRVLVIDDDQGQSGRSADGRAGFQRLVTEVTLNHVGIVLGLEMSRLARSHKDWHHLFEVCAVFGVLLADEDGVYDPSDPNDRLLLGLKGMISEVELLTMRSRLERGKLHKAERGELFVGAPLGYVRLPSGELDLDPDEQVRGGVRMIFDRFEELGSVGAVFRCLRRQGITLAVRATKGPNRGQVEQRPPRLGRLYDVLRHPLYAGAYAYGRRPVDPQRQASGRSRGGQRWVPMSQWKVLIRDRVPAYITWEHYLKNQECLKRNRQVATAPGVPRRGRALLGGLIVCGGCGWRMQVHYRTQGKPTYRCMRHWQQGEADACPGLQAEVVDDVVAAAVVQALEPAALELSLQAIDDLRKERERLDRHWQQQLARARAEAERAERQYRAVEPEHRLVARTLEQRWEMALRELARLQEDYDRFGRQEPAALTEQERARIRSLAEAIPALWQAEGTTDADRKEVLRCLVEKVMVDVQHKSEHVAIKIHWHGGFISHHEVIRPVRRYDQLRDRDGLMDRLVELRQAGQSAAGIAEQLNREGFRTPKRRTPFTAWVVRQLLHRRKLSTEKAVVGPLGSGEWWLPDLARALGMRPVKLRDWVLRGWVQSRQTTVRGLWVVWADAEELRRLERLQACSRRGVRSYPKELTTPQTRKSDCTPRGEGREQENLSTAHSK